MSKNQQIMAMVIRGSGGFMVGWALSPDHIVMGLFGVFILVAADGIVRLLNK